MAQKVDRDVGGAVPYFNDDVNGTDVLVQAGQTLVFSVSLHNVTAADAFFLLYDAAAIADVTVGTTVPDYVIPNAANAMVNMSFSKPLHFILGLVIASTTATDGSTDAAQDVSIGYA
jgi:hypothetical protein